MEKLDRKLQQRVWDRVYGNARPVFSPQTRQSLQQCRRRTQENARFFETMSGHSHYGEAFRHMARQEREHEAMLTQMLENK